MAALPRVDQVLLPCGVRLGFYPIFRLFLEQPYKNNQLLIVQSQFVEQFLQCTDSEWARWLAHDYQYGHPMQDDERRPATAEELRALKQEKLVPQHSSRAYLIAPSLAARAHAAFGHDHRTDVLLHRAAALKGGPVSGAGMAVPLRPGKFTIPPGGLRKRYGLGACGMGDLLPRAELEAYKQWRVEPVRTDRRGGEEEEGGGEGCRGGW